MQKASKLLSMLEMSALKGIQSVQT